VTLKPNTVCKSVRISLALISASCWASVSFAQAGEPSLTETLAWLDSTYNPHSDAGGAPGHGIKKIYKDGKLLMQTTTTFTYDRCQITLHTKDDPPVTQIYSEVYNFSLRDIDPNTIKLGKFDPDPCCNGLAGVAEIEFETRNQSPLMDKLQRYEPPLMDDMAKLEGYDHEGKKNTKTFVSEFYIDDTEYGNRFVKAFRHAVGLCGGTPSPF
jgi:hypothetical protein